MPIIRRYELTNGMAVNTNPLIMRENDLELGLNVDLSIIGTWRKRKGNLLYGSQTTSSQRCWGLHQFTNTAGTEYQLAVFSDGANNIIYKITSTTLNGAITTSTTTITLTSGTNFASSGTIEIAGDLITYTGKTGNNLTGVTGITDSHADASTVRQWISSLGSDTTGKKTRFSNFVDTVFRVNGAEAMNGSTDATTWNTTNCFALANSFPSLIETFQDRIFVSGNAGSAGLPDRLYASSIVNAAGTGVTWDTGTHIIDVASTAGFYIDINPEDGMNTTCLKRSGDILLIFKDRALYMWNGSSTQADTLVNIGTISQETVVNAHNITFFIGRSKKDLGIYAYTGGYPKLISRKVKRWTDNITQSVANLALLCAGATDSQVFFYIGNIAFTNDEIYGTRTFSDVWLVYHLAQDEWTVYDNLPARVFGNLVNSSSEKLYFGNNNGKVFEVDNGQTDDSGDGKTPIDLEIIGKEDSLGAPELDKSLEGITVASNLAQSTGVSYRYNRESDFKSLGSLKGRFTTIDAPHKSPIDNREGKTIQLKFKDNSSYTNSILGYSMNITQEGDIRK